MSIYPFDRESAVSYAEKWALSRNPDYYNFDFLGGDCTNFVSQCLFSGTKIMNYKPVTGWFYKSLNNRAPSWTGVEFFYNFITENISFGPRAVLVEKNQILPGDIIQLGRQNGEFYHALIVSKILNESVLTCSHTNDALNRPLDTYFYQNIRYLHVIGVKK